MEEDLRVESPESSFGEWLCRLPKVPRPRISDDYKVGMRLMEVFSIQFLDYKKVNLAEAYGTIFFECGALPHVLFERFPRDPLPIYDDGFLKLTDPRCAKTAYDRIDFYAFVYRLGDVVERVYDNIWNGIPDECLYFCNRLLTRRFPSVFGSIELNFAVYTESVTADLEIKFLGLRHEGILRPDFQTELFGSVTASTETILDERAKVVMFKRDKGACVLVNPWDTLSLTRRLVACPIRSAIVFHLSLYRPSNNGGSDDFIVNEDVTFSADIQKEELFMLESDYARMQLKVTFSDWFGQP